MPATDPFSFTVPDHAWVNLQWLYDLALYGLYQAGGTNLLVAAAAIAYGAAAWLLTRNLRLFLAPVGATALALAAGVQDLLDRDYEDHLAGYNRAANPDIPIGARLPGYGTSLFARVTYEF